MTNAYIQHVVRQSAPTLGAVWPNAMGFTWRGWEYSYGPRGWAALRGDKLGRGASPFDARAAATRQRRDASGDD